MAGESAFSGANAWLIGLQAGGLILETIDTKHRFEMIQQGRRLEKAAFESNLETLRAQSSEASLVAMQDLRENISNQIAINAARGVSGGAGSALSATNKSFNNFAKDERARRMNLLAKENELRAGDVLSGLHTLQSETELGQKLQKDIFEVVSGDVQSFGGTFGGGKKK